jgi:ADP-ribose pyrophosphatase
VTTYTHPDVLTRGIAEGWADPVEDPTLIDWEPRQRAALIPFEVIDGRPVNPHASTGIRYGRNQLGRWGEQVCADAFVTVCTEDVRWLLADARWLLMVERGDGLGWALPGGMVDPGETPHQAAVRELREETGLELPTCGAWGVAWETLPARYVPDPRASDEAWMVTVVSRCHLGTMRSADLPNVAGGDDATRAAWVRADNLHTLTEHLADTYSGRLFRAHEQVLAELLGSPS